jgi:hypothetical protein
MKLSHHAMSILKALPSNIARNDILPFILVVPFSMQYISRDLSGMKNSPPCWSFPTSAGIGVIEARKELSSRSRNSQILRIYYKAASPDIEMISRLYLSGIRIPSIHAFHVSSDLAPNR